MSLGRLDSVAQLSWRKPPHVTAVGLTQRTLQEAYGPGYHVRAQGPLTVSASSEPEPDVAVIRGDLRDYADEHPQTAALVVEVADTTGHFDRVRKGPIYAAAGIPEYWVLDLPAHVIDVYRDPAPDATGAPSIAPTRGSIRQARSRRREPRGPRSRSALCSIV